MYKPLTSTQQTSQFMYGFEESVAIRRQNLFGFADQKKYLIGLGYTLTLKRNNNNDAIFRTAAVDA